MAILLNPVESCNTGPRSSGGDFCETRWRRRRDGGDATYVRRVAVRSSPRDTRTSPPARTRRRTGQGRRSRTRSSRRPADCTALGRPDWRTSRGTPAPTAGTSCCVRTAALATEQRRRQLLTKRHPDRRKGRLGNGTATWKGDAKRCM